MDTSCLRPLIDADPLTYSVGFGEEHPDEPVEYALQRMKLAMEAITSAFPGCPREDVRVFLTGDGNYRDTVATVRPYKGNRDPNHKPRYYRELREYLKDWWHAEVVDGREADDAIGCAQWEAKDKSTVIVSIDKDLDLLPGYHWHPKKRVLYYVTLAEANYAFYRATLAGDPTDNIQGIFGVANKTAEKLLGPVGKPLTEYAKIVCAEYRRAYKAEWDRILMEMATLLWIQRVEGEGPHVPLLV